jgi:hypothetical protein
LFGDEFELLSNRPLARAAIFYFLVFPAAGALFGYVFVLVGRLLGPSDPQVTLIVVLGWTLFALFWGVKGFMWLWRMEAKLKAWDEFEKRSK